jgi:hypothetical protein
VNLGHPNGALQIPGFARNDNKEKVVARGEPLPKEKTMAMGVSNILCKRRFVVLALGYSAFAVEAVRMWEVFFALHICIA